MGGGGGEWPPLGTLKPGHPGAEGEGRPGHTCHNVRITLRCVIISGLAGRQTQTGRKGQIKCDSRQAASQPSDLSTTQNSGGRDPSSPLYRIYMVTSPETWVLQMGKASLSQRLCHASELQEG